MKQAVPYFAFDGNAREALEYYREVFGGEIEGIQTFGEADFPTPPEADDRIMHARFVKDDVLIMVSDSFLGSSVNVGNNVSIALEMDSEEEIRQVYNRLINGSKVIMELQDTFWGAKFAKVQDRFGFIWDLNYTIK
ncbi:VOC family protein [Peribacillus alkalitolerans]|uniref:VOC family protein n=1 Tax=Peribacillus alkalitolerans TaxID=1550385 RepID=UPI0013D45207|nr:VOC family protein [Peribacillus alkalitolerans]